MDEAHLDRASGRASPPWGGSACRPTALSDPDRVGARLRAALSDRYLVAEELGRGGMALVFRAVDRRHHRDVAVKVVRPDLAAAIGVERFLREIEIAAALQHPHILPLFDSGRADGLPFYVMPCVEGETLRERLQRGGALPVDEAVRVASQVGHALAYAHSRNIVHRDIKPENIMLSAGEAIVADFGIARAITAAAGDIITDPGLAVGTPAYMSPEQASGQAELDGRSDLYSLGCVLFEMLAGEPPFGGPTPQAVLARHRCERPPSVEVVRPAVGERLALILARTLEKTAADRFPTAEQFAEALDGAIDLPPRRRTARRTWVLPAAGVLAAVALAGWALWPPPAPDGLVVLATGRSAAADSSLADEARRLLSDRLELETDVIPVRIPDLAAAAGADGLLTAQEAGRLAGRLGATPVVLEMEQRRDSMTGRAWLGDRRRPFTVALPAASGLRTVVGLLADSILGVTGRPPPSLGGHAPSEASWRAYLRGQRARDRWDLALAASEFELSSELDPEFTQAHLWLAQVRAWAGRPAALWRGPAEAALADSAGLPRGERRLAAALVHLAHDEYRDACGVYRLIVASRPSDFAGWFGLGECHGGDPAVVPDPASPSGWAFRGSYHQAVRAYREAFHRAPEVYRAFRGLAATRLPRLLFAMPGRYREGRALGGDSLRFAASPTLEADTLAFVPYPEAQLLAGRGPSAAEVTAAVEANRRVLRQITAEWVQAFAGSADAHEQRGLVLETLGDPVSAGEAYRQAGLLADERLQRQRLGVARVRIAVKTWSFVEGRQLADSLLGALSPDIAMEEAATLAGLAALVGRRATALDLLRRAAPRWEYEADVPLPVVEAGQELLGLAALGASRERLRSVELRLERMIRSTWPEGALRSRMRRALLEYPAAIAYPESGALAVHRRASDNYLLTLQQALERRDAAGVRAQLDEIDASREGSGYQTSIDAAYVEARVLLAIGDTAQASGRLAAAMAPFHTLGVHLLDYVPHAATLVRAMALRAELAHRRGDPAEADRWARAVVALWASADRELQPMVEKMRRLSA